jgi:3-oxoacyl-[acyl-carrier protein] reductase
MDHKNAVVVGASGSIGREVCLAFNRKGFSGTAVDLIAPDRELLGWEYVISDINNPNLSFDLESVQHVVHIVGGSTDAELRLKSTGSLMETSEFREVLELNLVSAWSVLRAFLPIMLQGRGDRSFTFIGSINAYGGWGLPGYSSSKAALTGLVRQLAAYYGPQGIRTNLVTLGSVNTDGVRSSAALLGEVFDPAKIAQTAPLRRILEASEVAEVVSSIALSFVGMTGSEVVLDCGQSITR